MKQFDLKKSVNVYLNIYSSFSDFSQYFRFLILNQEERLKSSSGSLKVNFPATINEMISVELYGYDTLTISNHEFIERNNELELKKELIFIFENERKEIINNL